MMIMLMILRVLVGIDDDDDDCAYRDPQIFSEEGEKTENQSDGGVYQLRSTS